MQGCPGSAVREIFCKYGAALRVKSILVVRNDRFGEFLLNIAALRALKEAYPGAKIVLAVSLEVKELAECVEYVDQIAVWDTGFKGNLRKYNFDACIILNPTKEAHWLSFLAGIPVRVGYNRKWGFLLTHKSADNKGLGLKHEVETNLELVGLIGAKTKDSSVYLGKLPPSANPVYAGAVAVHPFTSDAVKQWPVERFRQLARRLSGELRAKVLIVGKGEGASKGRAREEFDHLGDEIINLIDKTSLVELAQLLKQCRLLVTCDSGPMHLAAAVGTPVVALFRNDLPGKTARRWGPWGEGNIVIEKGNLLDISVNEVMEAVKPKLLTGVGTI